MQLAATTQNISPTTRSRAELLKTQEQSQLYEPRIKNPLKRLSETLSSPNELLSTTELNKYSETLRQITDHMETRQQVTGNLQMQMCDEDLESAVECAEFFRAEAINAENAENELLTQISHETRQTEKAEEMAQKAENEFSLFADQFGNFDRSQLLSQLTRIRQSAAESALLATELGYQIPEQPDILDVLSEANFDTYKDGFLVVDGVRRAAKSVCLSLLSAEIQCLRDENFLRKQAMSEAARSQSAALLDEDTVAAFSMTQEGATSAPVALVAEALRPRERSPIVLYQEEFKCSGVAACREVISLRERLASYLLREQRFAEVPLLQRNAQDNETLRALVCGLQNELYFAQERIEQALAVDAGVEGSKPAADRAPQFTDDEIQDLAELALNEHVEIDLIPMTLARKIDFLIAEVEEESAAAAEAKVKASKAEISVEMLQKTLETRNEMARRMNAAETELEEFLTNTNVISNIDQKLQEFVESRFGLNVQNDQEDHEVDMIDLDTHTSQQIPENTVIHAEGRTAFIKAATDFAETRAKEFRQLCERIDVFYDEIRESLSEGNTERFESGGEGFLDALNKICVLMQHCRDMHVALARRDHCVVRLQDIIDDLIAQKHDVSSQLASVCTVRNGLILSYLRLRKHNEALSTENNTIRGATENCVYLATENLAARADTNLSEILARDSNEYTQSVKGGVMCIEDFVEVFGRQLDTVINRVRDAVEEYRAIIENKAQKACETDRRRRTEEIGLQVAIEPVDSKAAKKK